MGTSDHVETVVSGCDAVSGSGLETLLVRDDTLVPLLGSDFEDHEVIVALGSDSGASEEVQVAGNSGQRHASPGFWVETLRLADLLPGEHTGSRVQHVQVIETFDAIPAPEDEQPVLHHSGRVIRTGHRIVGSVDVRPLQTLGVEAVQVVQVVSAIPSPEDVDQFLDGVGRVHVARPRGYS